METISVDWKNRPSAGSLIFSFISPVAYFSPGGSIEPLLSHSCGDRNPDCSERTGPRHSLGATT